VSRYVAHLDTLTVPVFSPLHNRDWMITPREFRLMCRILAGRQFTLRELAAEIGYSRSGLQGALQSLISGGLVVVRTKLGCKGWTFAKVKPGVVATRMQAAIRDVIGSVISNVRYPSTSLVVDEVTTESPLADIQYDVFYEGSS
jgi:predicted transcriptional regulator